MCYCSYQRCAQVLPGHIDTYYCQSPIPPDLFDTPRASTSGTTSLVKKMAPYCYNSGQMISMQQQEIETTPGFEGQYVNQSHMSIPQFTKKYTFVVEVSYHFSVAVITYHQAQNVLLYITLCRENISSARSCPARCYTRRLVRTRITS